MPVSSNKRKNGQVKAAPPKPSKRDQFIAEQEAIYNSCVQLVATTTNNTAALIRNAAAVHKDKLDLDAIRPKSQALADDVGKLNDELKQIRAESEKEINQLTRKTDELEVMTVTVNVGNRYDNWQQRFLQVTGPLIADITGLCQLEEIATNDA